MTLTIEIHILPPAEGWIDDFHLPVSRGKWKNKQLCVLCASVVNKLFFRAFSISLFRDEDCLTFFIAVGYCYRLLDY